MSDYSYDASLIRVIDGDTCDLDVDLGFDVHAKMRFRLIGINAPELRAKDLDERQRAQTARDQLAFRLTNQALVVETVKDKTEKYGRYLATIYVAGSSVNAELLAAGLVKAYP